jgi:hypothetical protein
MAKRRSIPGYRKRDRWKHQWPLIPDYRYKRVKPMAKINKYHCGHCKQDTVTREDPARLPADWASPFLIECPQKVERVLSGKKGFALCGQSAQSAMYKNCEGLTPAYEWRTATPDEIKASGPNRAQYFRNGGISLFPLAETTKKTIEFA